jgi:oligopeptide/dipeptide ABC transporter ATP-binding protein
MTRPPDGLLEISHLDVSLLGEGVRTRLIEDVTLRLDRGEVLGLVGESGSGKSMLALAVPGLLPANIRITGGSIRLDGQELGGMRERALRQLRGARISMIFQEPMTALNPLMRVGDQIMETLATHGPGTGAERRRRMEDALEEVGLRPPREVAGLYPHELSGGMRQRVMIAIATVCSPDIIIADEPTTALDVTVQAQILALLRSIVERRGCALVLISHDIGVIGALAHRVAVMYAGSVVEDCPADAFAAGPGHPYSRLLVETYVDIDMAPVRPLPTIRGLMPLAGRQGPGCRFAPRCPHRTEVCDRATPVVEAAGEGHRIACHHWTRLAQPLAEAVGVGRAADRR